MVGVHLQKALAIVLTLVSLYGCAAVDTACMDTAEIPNNQGLRVTMHSSLGPDLSKQQTITQDPDSSNLYEDMVSLTPALTIAQRIGKSSELGGRFWLTPLSVGGKLFYKRQVYKQGFNTVAVIPAFTYVYSDAEKFDYGAENGVQTYKAAGLETQAVGTRAINKSLSLSLVARCNYHYYQENIMSWPHLGWESTHIFHGGLRANARLNLNKKIFLMGEGGLEWTPVPNKEYGFFPVMALGLGFQ